MHGAPRTSAGPAALFDEHFVPRVGVPSGMGMLMPKPDDEHLSTKDQLHKKSIRMQSAERILEYHKDIRTAILTGNGIDADKPMTQDRRDNPRGQLLDVAQRSPRSWRTITWRLSSAPSNSPSSPPPLARCSCGMGARCFPAKSAPPKLRCPLLEAARLPPSRIRCRGGKVEGPSPASRAEQGLPARACGGTSSTRRSKRPSTMP